MKIKKVNLDTVIGITSEIPEWSFLKLHLPENQM